MTIINDANLRLPDEARALTETLWPRWLADLDRYDGRGTAVTDPTEKLQVQLSLIATSLLLAALPAGQIDDLRAKTLVAAWLRTNDLGDNTLAMVEAAITTDMARLQPVDDLLV
ncbi:hypothetical protein [Lichenifustis flavocetrariae]|uniref:Uncharacterized protein n=1 Tax=Lichenifustis flavocetrariae TaxID=2949735 RepID=A0AA42CR28_9HYPH|nr:hypothetical protein [Lichenifustis flavocetrariae]MCW6512047.1 hypothetical protein [Lichenifustis flavocetrariae]